MDDTKQQSTEEVKVKKQSPIVELSYIQFINAITIDGVTVGYWDHRSSSKVMSTAKVAFNKEDQVIIISANNETYLVPVSNVRQMTVKKK